MKFLFLIAALLCQYSTAGELLIGQFTHHFNERGGGEEFESVNPLIGYSSDKYTLIAMRNSYDRNSIAVMRTDRADFGRYLTGAISMGIASGYDEFKSDYNVDGVIPVGFLSLDIHPASDDFGIVVTLAPDRFIGAGLRISL